MNITDSNVCYFLFFHCIGSRNGEMNLLCWESKSSLAGWEPEMLPSRPKHYLCYYYAEIMFYKCT